MRKGLDIILHYLFKRRLIKLRQKKEFYRADISSEKKIAYQKVRFNEIWKHAYSKHPFYSQWKKKHSLPDVIGSISELNSFPPLTKKDINENQALILNGLKHYYLTSTGGTSGITTHFPTSKNDADNAYANAYLGRSWWEIQPFDNILMFWGHSHLFGKGIKSYIAKAKRNICNYFINTKKMSSYSLSYKNVEKFYGAIIRIKPKVIISYTSNLFQICKFMESRGLNTKGKVDYIILTSETATNADIALFNKLFGAQIINEYGMAETGVIGYSFQKTDNIRILWDAFIGRIDGNESFHVTTIEDKLFPLINYNTEDRVEVSEVCDESILSLKAIVGKQRDILKIKDASGNELIISTILFDHVLKHYQNIYSIHYKQKRNNVVEVYVTSDSQLDLIKLKAYFIREIQKEIRHMSHDAVSFVQIDVPAKTMAGKNKVRV
jgi:phenylacetate-coenzyme A ligase PaaK-like adenylate-forming protein